MKQEKIKYVVQVNDWTGMSVNHVFDNHSKAKEFIKNLFNHSDGIFAYCYYKAFLSELKGDYELG